MRRRGGQKARRESFAELKERTLNDKKENRCGDVDAEFDGEKRGRRPEVDIVGRAELFGPVNYKFLNQVSAVGDAGDERSAGNCNSTERESGTDGANKKHSHRHGDEWELPDAGSDSEVFG